MCGNAYAKLNRSGCEGQAFQFGQLLPSGIDTLRPTWWGDRIKTTRPWVYRLPALEAQKRNGRCNQSGQRVGSCSVPVLPSCKLVTDATQENRRANSAFMHNHQNHRVNTNQHSTKIAGQTGGVHWIFWTSLAAVFTGKIVAFHLSSFLKDQPMAIEPEPLPPELPVPSKDIPPSEVPTPSEPPPVMPQPPTAGDPTPETL
jgi:hypothetical protein